MSRTGNSLNQSPPPSPVPEQRYFPPFICVRKTEKKKTIQILTNRSYEYNNNYMISCCPSSCMHSLNGSIAHSFQGSLVRITQPAAAGEREKRSAPIMAALPPSINVLSPPPLKIDRTAILSLYIPAPNLLACSGSSSSPSNSFGPRWSLWPTCFILVWSLSRDFPLLSCSVVCRAFCLLSSSLFCFVLYFFGSCHISIDCIWIWISWAWLQEIKVQHLVVPL